MCERFIGRGQAMVAWRVVVRWQVVVVVVVVVVMMMTTMMMIMTVLELT